MDHPSSPDRDPKRLLLVEDDVDQAHLVKYLLEADGTLAVTLAQDGIRAMHLLEESDWDLLITDINLPGADGIEVVEASRRLRPDLPILATTGYTGPEYGARARERGADAVLIKPLDRDDLLHHVETLLTDRAEKREAAPTLVKGLRGEKPPGSKQSVLVLSARPGDAEAGCSGAILAHVQGGDRVILLHLAGRPPLQGTNQDSDRDRETVKAAGRRLGARTFITSLEDPGEEGPEEAHDDLVRLVSGAIVELCPDVLYVPTAHHPHVRHQTVNRVAREAATDVPTVLAYDPGDASPSFAPELFVPLGETRMDEKLRVTTGYESWGIDRLQPGAIRASAAFWARYTDRSLAEGFEVIRATSDTLSLPSSQPHSTRDAEENE